MPYTRRIQHLGLLALTSLLACARSEAPPPAPGLAAERAAATVATFEGWFEPGKGLTIKTTPVATPGVLGSWVAAEPYQDGNPGSGPVDSFELVTDATPAPVVTSGGCGTEDSFDGHVTLRSFFKTQAFTDVAIELTEVSTGYEACNSSNAYAGTGLSNTYGLWSYGGIGVANTPSDHVSQLWRFRFGLSQPFKFRGRIMAQAAALPVPPSGIAEFDWRPYMFANPPHSFHEGNTTISHVVWTGTSFVDTKGVANFQPVGATAADHIVGVAYPVQHWAGPFLYGADRYQASPTPAALNFTGDFTVCVKFKPGFNPAPLDRKVLVAKGNPVDQLGAGWALTQQHGPVLGGGPQYGFFYITQNDGDTDSYVFPGDNPENSTFDYSCGGRAGNLIRVVAHGRDTHFANTVTGTFPDVAALPLSIGAAPDGLWPATDAGVYEVIFDSRGATLDVMNEIVDGAEGQATYNGGSYNGNDFDALAVKGVDGLTYNFPLGATAPVSTDGSGLLDAGGTLTFGGFDLIKGIDQGPVLEGTPGAYCIGAEVASADWASAAGCVLGDTTGYLKLFFEGSTAIKATTGKDQYVFQYGDRTGWSANSRHTLLVCTPGPLTDAAAATLYVDGAYAGATTPSGPQFNPTTGQLLVGTCQFGGGDLTGARIGRVFACPTSDHTACQ